VGTRSRSATSIGLLLFATGIDADFSGQCDSGRTDQAAAFDIEHDVAEPKRFRHRLTSRRPGADRAGQQIGEARRVHA